MSMPEEIIKKIKSALDLEWQQNQDKIRYSGGDGGGINTAVIITGAEDSRLMIMAERKWLDSKYGLNGWKLVRQSLVEKGSKSFDKIDVSLQSGGMTCVYFDITIVFQGTKIKQSGTEGTRQSL